jgi:8-oxo-dGTP pyrophosphatase MutT (NUDIX family)
VREALEEVGVSIEPTDLQPVHVRYRLPHDATGDRVDVFFHCCTWRGDVCNAEPDKCSEIAWHPIDDLPTHVIPYVAEVLRAITAGQVYSEER